MAKPLPPNELLRATMIFDRLSLDQRAELMVELSRRYVQCLDLKAMSKADKPDIKRNDHVTPDTT